MDILQLPPVVSEGLNGNCIYEYNANYILFWNHVGLEFNRLSHKEVNGQISGPYGGPPLSARALAILHIAIHDAYFGINPPTDWKTYLDGDLPPLNGANDAKVAVAAAALLVLEKLYLPSPRGTVSLNLTSQLHVLLENTRDDFTKRFDPLFPTRIGTASFVFGQQVGLSIFNLLKHDAGARPGVYELKKGRYQFEDEPTHPVRIVPKNPDLPDGPKMVTRPHHAAEYGFVAQRIAIQTDHLLADPPGILSANNADDLKEYDEALDDVIRMGGNVSLNSTRRSAAQNMRAHFWAYDGANLIGTPPRLYNQIVRSIAYRYRKNRTAIDAEENNVEFARLFALVNTAIGDAGILAWREKYWFNYWRPLSGLSQGAPSTNSHELPFKPPFPAYPSGHATFGAACFQIVRRFYKDHRKDFKVEEDGPDNINFDMIVSDELNGISRELRTPYDPSQPIIDQVGTVRPLVKRKFDSCWEAIFENALSRVWLGVHWRFDACAAADILEEAGSKQNKNDNKKQDGQEHEQVVPDNSSGQPHNDISKSTCIQIYKIDCFGRTVYKDVSKIKYGAKGTRRGESGEYHIGGIPLGLCIADDIYESGMVKTRVDPMVQPLDTKGTSPCLPPEMRAEACKMSREEGGCRYAASHCA